MKDDEFIKSSQETQLITISLSDVVCTEHQMFVFKATQLNTMPLTWRINDVQSFNRSLQTLRVGYNPDANVQNEDGNESDNNTDRFISNIDSVHRIYNFDSQSMNIDSQSMNVDSPQEDQREEPLLPVPTLESISQC